MNRSPGTLITRYARSLFAAARERNTLDSVRSDLQALHELWMEQPELKTLLTNPGLSRKKVRAILSALGDNLTLSDVTRAFMNVLLDKRRLDILADIQPAFEKLMFEHERRIEVKVTTAVPLSDSLQQQIEQHLKNKSGKDPVVEWKENPAIIGGLVIEWPDRVFDGSLARKIQNLREHLVGA